MLTIAQIIDLHIDDELAAAYADELQPKGRAYGYRILDFPDTGLSADVIRLD